VLSARSLPLAVTFIVALTIVVGPVRPASATAAAGVRSFPLPPRTYGSLIAGLDGAPWFVAQGPGTTSILKIADRSAGGFRDVPLPFKAHVGVAVDGAGWFLSSGAQGTGALWRVDPVTGLSSQVAATSFVTKVLTSDGRAHRVYFADSPQTGTVWQLHAVDTATQAVTTVATFEAETVTAQAVASDGAVWLGVVDRGDPNFGRPDSSLLRLDPSTGQLATVVPSGAGKYRQLAPAPGGDVWMAREAPRPKGFDALQAGRVRPDGRLSLFPPPALLGPAPDGDGGPTSVTAAPDGGGWFLEGTHLPSLLGGSNDGDIAWSLVAVDPATGHEAYTALPVGSPEGFTALGDGTVAYYDEPAAHPAKAVVQITPGALTTAAPKPPSVSRSIMCRHRCQGFAQLSLSAGHGRAQPLVASRRLAFGPGRHTVRLTPSRKWTLLVTRLTRGTLTLEIAFRDGKRFVSQLSRLHLHPAAALPPVEPPVAGVRGVAQPLSGQVVVRLPSSPDPVPLASAASLPVGAVVDARKGSLTFASAADASGGVQSATLAAGIFRIRQSRATGTAAAPTDFVLVTPRGLGRACASRRTRPAKGVVRTLSVTATKGVFRTVGAKSVATATRGAAWTTSDRCDGTLTTVRRGQLSVHAGRHTVTVRGGHSYLARARLFAAKRGTR
jgi:hypothetical protein